MNEIVNKFLFAWNAFKHKFTGLHIACGPFTKHKQKNAKFKKTGDSRYIYQND